MLLLVVLYFFVCIERINSRNGRMSKKELLFFLFVLAAGGVMAQQYRERGILIVVGIENFLDAIYLPAGICHLSQI